MQELLDFHKRRLGEAGRRSDKRNLLSNDNSAVQLGSMSIPTLEVSLMQRHRSKKEAYQKSLGKIKTHSFVGHADMIEEQ